MSFLAGTHVFKAFPAYTTTELRVRTKCSSICSVAVELYLELQILSFFHGCHKRIWYVAFTVLKLSDHNVISLRSSGFTN